MSESRVMKLTKELGHETPVMALLHAQEMERALKVIYTWASFPPLECADVQQLISKALRMEK